MIYTDGTPTIASAGACLPSERTAAADIRCPECGETVWDVAYGHKLHKCWNTEGHKDGGTLAFDTPADDDDGPQYVVVENTPGYLPEDDDPATFDTFDEALDYASDRATYLVEELDYREVDRSIDRERETASAWFQYRYSTNDLGRVIEVSRLEVK